MLTKAIKKVLIANRGEIAIRVIRACRRREAAAVAVYSDADRAALHVAMADEAVRIGPAPAARSYLDAGAILDAARAVGADAVHPGYGFLAENAAFAEAVEAAGMAFIGPRPETMRLMGDKVAARKAAMAAGVPVIPGSDGAVGAGELASVAGRLGFPLMLKAAGGGGGKGIRIVREAGELDAAFAMASSEAKNAFGDAAVYVERYIERPRHIEVQVFGDAQGGHLHFGERECSLQRRHQKVVEESPAPGLSPEMRAEICGTAVALAAAIDYRGAGTLEFLVEGEDFRFLEMNTRLQVEHAVTEEVTGVDLVDLQFDVAEGRPLPLCQDDVVSHGHAIEVRVYAEDPDLGFMPSGGRVDSLFLPSGPGVRLETALYAGCEVALHYDPMLAKVVTRGADRVEALRRMQGALREFVLTGPRTNLAFVAHLLMDPKVVAGRVHTHHLESFLERWMDRTAERAGKRAAMAAVAAALVAHDARSAPAGPAADAGASGAASAWRRAGLERQLGGGGL